jgi:hypothetical protein
MFWTRAARPIATMRLSFASPVVRLSLFLHRRFRMMARRRMCFFADWRRVEVSARLSDNLLAEAGSQISRLNFLYRAVVKSAQLERTKCDADQSIHS